MGCGSSTKNTSIQGQLSGTSIQGLSYQTPSISGTTDSNGAFKYQAGESIQFSVGATLVGENVPAQTQLALHDLLPKTVLYTDYAHLQHVYAQPYKSPIRGVFNQFHNTLAFLYSLDNDANPDNGINIPAGVNDLMLNTQIDFNQNVKGFTGKDQSRWGDGNEPLRRITHQATEQGLLSRGTISSYGLAIEHYYQANNIEHNLQIDTIVSIDTDLNQIPDSITTYEYNANGQRTRYTEDNNGDGNLNKITVTSYNNNNRYLSQHRDDNGDGTVNSIDTYTLGIYGNTIKHQADSNADQTPDNIYHTEYDKYGHEVLSSTDDNADGTPERIDIIIYEGNTISYQTDDNGDEIIDKTNIETLDENGNIILSTDYVGDAIANNLQPSAIHTYTYDENNNQLTRRSDYDGNGIINAGDRVYTLTYNNDNYRLTESRDSDGDGLVDQIYSNEYNAMGFNTLSATDEGADGNIDYSFSNSYNEQGYKTGYQSDNNGDGTPNRIDTYSYDENGNRIRFEYDRDGNGQADTIYTYTYNDYGNLVTKSEDSNGDDQVNKITTYTNSASVFRTVLDEFN